MRLFSSFAVLSLVWVSASRKKEISPDYRVPPPLVELLPTTVGVYYGDDFRDARIKSGASIEFEFIIIAGRADVSLYEHLFSGVILEAVPLRTRLQAPESGGRFGAIMKPEITTFTYNRAVLNGDVSVGMNYSFSLYSPDGEQLTEWNVGGFGCSSEGSGAYNTLTAWRPIGSLSGGPFMKRSAASLPSAHPSGPSVPAWIIRTSAR